VIVKAYKILQLPLENIITVTMPGFGTTDRTYQNAIILCQELGTDLREIAIVDAALLHFRDIGHDPSTHDATYENVQARERTQILMDIANKEGGIVVGTGDLSELALGWCTYNGDQMSMYGVNASVPKTLVRYLIRYFLEEEFTGRLAEALQDVLDTPVSPELLPKGDNDELLQKTEDLVGPYELHDFFLYHAVKYGADYRKILFLAEIAFQGVYPREVILRWLRVFIKRFYSQQFKRSAMPDGPKVGSISLSPRGDLRMPSDASAALYLAQLEEEFPSV
jgi:NAD+ synthase (glutamine-hydrolysing)